MSITTRTLMAAPLAAAALAFGAGPALADPVELPNLDIAQPEDPEPEPGPQDGPDDKDGPNPDDGPGPQDGPDDLDGPKPADEPGPLDGPDDLANPDDDDSDDDDGDNDDEDGDDDDGDSDKDDDGDGVRRPTRVDAGGPSDNGMSLAWVLAGGAVVSAAGSFAARKRLS